MLGGMPKDMANTNSLSDKLLETIDYAIERQTKDLRNNFVRATVIGILPDKKYKVSINGAEYGLRSGNGLSYSSGDVVMVHIPNGDYNKAYILSSVTGSLKIDDSGIDIDLSKYVIKDDLTAGVYNIPVNSNQIATLNEITSLFAQSGGGVSG